MRINFRLKIFNRTLFMMYSKTQTLEGIRSKIKSTDKHHVFWDLEGCTLEEVKATLRSVQADYGLGDIYIFSDCPQSYRAWCFTQVDFKTYLRILLETEYVCYNFFYWTVYRGESTLRISMKKNRQKQHLVAILKTYPESIPNILNHVKYDTAIGKKGINILTDIGEK